MSLTSDIFSSLKITVFLAIYLITQDENSILILELKRKVKTVLRSNIFIFAIFLNEECHPIYTQ